VNSGPHPVKRAGAPVQDGQIWGKFRPRSGIRVKYGRSAGRLRAGLRVSMQILIQNRGLLRETNQSVGSRPGKRGCFRVTAAGHGPPDLAKGA
jgi:hypothetical protein